MLLKSHLRERGSKVRGNMSGGKSGVIVRENVVN